MTEDKNHDMSQLLVLAKDAHATAAEFQKHVAKIRRKTTIGNVVWYSIGGITTLVEPMIGIPIILGKIAHSQVTKRLTTYGTPAFDQLGQSQNLQFPWGPPRAGVVYARHPKKNDAYIPLSAFHTYLFDEKASELERLLLCLGAKKIITEHVEGKEINFSSRISGNGTVASHGEMNAKKTLFRFSHISTHGRSPYLPDDLVWYPYEPSWKSLATGRLNADEYARTTVFEYKSDFGITGSLSFGLNKLGLDTGGSFEKHVSSTTLIHVEF